MVQLLLVEDDPILGRSLHVTLETEGYAVDWVQSLSGARETVRAKQPNLFVLDVNLPDGSGYDLLTEIRKERTDVPVILLTAKTDEDSVVRGLNLGANDYVRKPFGQKELLARISSALRMPMNAAKGTTLKYESLSIDLEKRQVKHQDRTLDVNRREFDILVHLVRHAEAVVTRESLLNALDKDGEIFDRTIDSHISHLRARFRKGDVNDIQINSIYGVGYRLEKKGGTA
ncbi:MAG: response regulator transcription factor [Bdellovibrionales bacterium]|nr:response regulator transcription factor [Bdellovibrionales bacterium]